MPDNKNNFLKGKKIPFLAQYCRDISRLSYLIVYILTTTILHFDFLDRFSDLLKLAMMMGFGHPVQMYSPLSIVSLQPSFSNAPSVLLITRKMSGTGW